MFGPATVPGGEPAGTRVERLFLTQLYKSWVSAVVEPAPVVLERSTSMAPNQNSLFLISGPPMVALISLRWNVGTEDSKWVSADRSLFVNS